MTKKDLHWIEKAAEELGVTIYGLEQKCGVSKNHFRYLITNGTPIDKVTVGTLEKVANQLGMDAAEYLILNKKRG